MDVQGNFLARTHLLAQGRSHETPPLAAILLFRTRRKTDPTCLQSSSPSRSLFPTMYLRSEGLKSALLRIPGFLNGLAEFVPKHLHFAFKLHAVQDLVSILAPLLRTPFVAL